MNQQAVNPRADINGDGRVDTGDLTEVLANFNQSVDRQPLNPGATGRPVLRWATENHAGVFGGAPITVALTADDFFVGVGHVEFDLSHAGTINGRTVGRRVIMPEQQSVAVAPGAQAFNYYAFNLSEPEERWKGEITISATAVLRDGTRHRLYDTLTLRFVPDPIVAEPKPGSTIAQMQKAAGAGADIVLVPRGVYDLPTRMADGFAQAGRRSPLTWLAPHGGVVFAGRTQGDTEVYSNQRFVGIDFAFPGSGLRIPSAENVGFDRCRFDFEQHEGSINLNGCQEILFRSCVQTKGSRGPTLNQVGGRPCRRGIISGLAIFDSGTALSLGTVGQLTEGVIARRCASSSSFDANTHFNFITSMFFPGHVMRDHVTRWCDARGNGIEPGVLSDRPRGFDYNFCLLKPTRDASTRDLIYYGNFADNTQRAQPSVGVAGTWEGLQFFRNTFRGGIQEEGRDGVEGLVFSGENGGNPGSCRNLLIVGNRLGSIGQSVGNDNFFPLTGIETRGDAVVAGNVLENPTQTVIPEFMTEALSRSSGDDAHRLLEALPFDGRGGRASIEPGSPLGEYAVGVRSIRG